MQRLALIITLVAVIFGCSQGPEIQEVRGGRKAQSEDASLKDDKKNKKKASKRDDEGNDEEDHDGEDDRNDEDDRNNDRVEDSSDDDLIYPQFQFNGTGHTTYKNSDQFPMRSSIATKMDASSLSLTTTQSKVDCKPKCDQNEVDRDMSKTIGTNTYERTAKADLNRLKQEQSFHYASYAVFASAAQKAGGGHFRFDSPLPVFPWPAAMTRYEELKGNQHEWTSRVHGPNMSFTATVRVTHEGQNGKQVTIKLQLTIHEDQAHKFYGEFPMAREAYYVIDTSTKDVVAINSTSAYHGKKSDKAEVSVLAFNLCSKTTGEKTQEFSCPAI